jgi:energy-coupling factor transporter ATP-binding protein EcfA2
MLYKIEIENFFAIRDAQVLDLTIAPNVPDPDGRYANLFRGSELRAPKVIALYGANASGKTTVLRALEFIISMVRDSAQRTAPGFACERFNDVESCSRPIRLAIELGGVMNYSPELMKRLEAGETVDEGLYRYEISIDVKDGAAQRIASEALRQKPNGHGKWQRVFERDAEGKVKDSRSFPLTGYHHLLNTLRPNVSVLSSFAMFQHRTAMLFVQLAQKAIFQLGNAPDNDQQIIKYLVQQPEILSKLNKELSRIDVGVEGMRFVDTASGPAPMFKHAGLQVEMPWMLESHGTRTFIKMFPAIAVTLAQGGIFAIDELDASIHPLVLPEILRWFHDKGTRNPLDAQLWFSCHSVSLLDELKKEEIVICEKDRQGRTKVYSLMDVKVRRDDNHYRKYLSGAYGGVPQIG